jgi:hypothetical protein
MKPDEKPQEYNVWTRPGSGKPHTYDRTGELEGNRTGELEGELVVGHAEYRAVAMRSESFRRAFAEVYRSRSLLFLGSGLRDRYLLDMFSQVSELYGASSQPHYAVVCANEVDVEFHGRYFGIRVVEVDRYTEIPSLLSQIQAAANDSTARRRWSYQKPSPTRQTSSSVEIREGEFDATKSPLGCIIISGGGGRDWPRVNLAMIDYLVAVGVLPKHLRSRPGDTRREEDARREYVGRMLRQAEGRSYTWVFDDTPNARNRDCPTVFVARARLEAHSQLGRQNRPVAHRTSASRGDRAGRLWRDLRLIKPVMIEALEVGAEAGHQAVQSTILSSGDLRSFPASFALQEMVRAWTHAAIDGHYLRIHVIDPPVLGDLRSGRLDLAHSISVSGSTTEGAVLQFWLEVVEGGGRSTRLLELRHATSSVRDLLKEHSLLNHRWTISLWPEPCLEWIPWTVDDIAAWEADHNGSVMTLETFGVVHGSTLRIAEGDAYDKPRKV